MMKVAYVLALLFVVANARYSHNKRVLNNNHNVDVSEAAALLIPFLDSETSQVACVIACTGAASSVLGPAAAAAPLVCPPVCREARAQLKAQAQEQAGR